MTGLCECGCGRPAPVAKRTNTRFGHVKGQQLRFIKGHSSLMRTPPYVVDESTGCWEWQRAKTSHGYGLANHNGRQTCAHIKYFELAHGAVPAGLEIDHLCRNVGCVNPDHLEAVTHAENVRRSARTKLTWRDVDEIRCASESRSALAKRFGVHRETIRQIQCGITWTEAACQARNRERRAA